MSHFGTGAWCPSAEHLSRAREYIAENYEELESILLENGLRIHGECLKRMPAGYDADHPAGEYLKFKNWFVSRSFADSELGDVDSFMEIISCEMARMEPLRRFLDEALREKVRDPWADFRW